MKINIAESDGLVIVGKDYRFKELGEIPQILLELEIIKQELLEIWKKN